MKIPGVAVFPSETHFDPRGSFTKIFTSNSPAFPEPYVECYYSVSKRGVVRGLHFQEPPYDHVKLVSCLGGAAFDCVLDLRRNSPSYGEADHVSLMPGDTIVIPRGCAHGFCAVDDETTLLYHVSSAYAPEHDRGIHWRSAKVPWPVADPVLSDRDRQFPTFSEYLSPF